MIELFGFAFHAIYIHLGALALTTAAILTADESALSWMRGKREVLPARFLRTLHTLVWVGLITMILSGVYMALPLRDYLQTNPAFWIKMFFVLLLVINSFFIGRFMHVASEKPFAALTLEEKRPLFISGGVSTLGWLGAFVAALYMTTSDWVLMFISRLMNLF